MTTVLNFDLKDCLSVLTKDYRWNVLTVLILHGNIRNRCWTGMETIARLATNGNLTKATNAKKWLKTHRAFDLVSFSKRVDEEKELPPRLHVYQLTGVILKCGDPGCDCAAMSADRCSYLYHNTPNLPTIENFNQGQVLTTDNFNGGNLSKSSRSNKKIEPDGSQPSIYTISSRQHPNQPLRDALLEQFGHSPETVTKTADKQYWNAAAELQKIDVTVEQIAPLYQYVSALASEGKWSKFTVMALAKYAPDFLKGDANPASITQGLKLLTPEKIADMWRNPDCDAESLQEEDSLRTAPDVEQPTGEAPMWT